MEICMLHQRLSRVPPDQKKPSFANRPAGLCMCLCMYTAEYPTISTERTLSITPQNYTVVEGQKVNITLELDSDAFDCEFNVTLQHMDGSATGERYDHSPELVSVD